MSVALAKTLLGSALVVLILVLVPAAFMWLMLGLARIMGLANQVICTLPTVAGLASTSTGPGWLLLAAAGLLVVTGLVLLGVWARRRRSLSRASPAEEVPWTVRGRRDTTGDIDFDEYMRMHSHRGVDTAAQ